MTWLLPSAESRLIVPSAASATTREPWPDRRRSMMSSFGSENSGSMEDFDLTEPMITAAEFASILGVTEADVLQWMLAGRIPYVDGSGESHELGSVNSTPWTVLRLVGPALDREVTSGGASPLGDACSGAAGRAHKTSWVARPSVLDRVAFPERSSGARTRCGEISVSSR
jgi:hypothetical protein